MRGNYNNYVTIMLTQPNKVNIQNSIRLNLRVRWRDLFCLFFFSFIFLKSGKLLWNDWAYVCFLMRIKSPKKNNQITASKHILKHTISLYGDIKTHHYFFPPSLSLSRVPIWFCCFCSDVRNSISMNSQITHTHSHSRTHTFFIGW